MKMTPKEFARKRNREARRILGIAFAKSVEIENRKETPIARGKDYVESYLIGKGDDAMLVVATHEREKARRVRHMEAHTHGL
jgi:hypothetical protein